VITSSVIPSLKYSWLASSDKFLNGSTATEGRPARRAGAARLATSTAPGERRGETEQIAASTHVKRPCDQAGGGERGGPSGGEKCSPASARSRRRRRYTHCVSADGLGDVLDAMAAERAVIEIELIPDLVVDLCEMQIVPGCASPSSRTAMLTPSPRCYRRRQ
jgi:hypothetical protein